MSAQHNLLLPMDGARVHISYNNFEIDVTDLNVVQGRDGVFVIPNESPLDLTDRIVSFEKVGQ